MEFSAFLTKHRERLGLSQEDFAAQNGISVWSLRNLEQGRALPAFETVVKLNAALGLSLGDWDGIVVEAKKPGKAKPKTKKK